MRLSQRATAASQALEKAEEELDLLRKTCAEFEANQSGDGIMSLRQQLEASQAQCEELEAAKGNAEADANQAQNRLRRVQKQVEKLRREVAESPVEALKERISMLEQELESKERSASEVETKWKNVVADVEARLQAALDDVQSLQQKLQIATEDAQKAYALRQQVEAVEAEAGMERQRADAAEDSRDKLLREMNSLAEAKIEGELLAAQRQKQCEELELVSLESVTEGITL